MVFQNFEIFLINIITTLSSGPEVNEVYLYSDLCVRFICHPGSCYFQSRRMLLYSYSKAKRI